MKRTLRTSSIVIMACLALAACNDDDGDDGEQDSRSELERQFGPTFAAAFNADEDAEPLDETRDGFVSVSSTDDPVEF